MPATVPVKSLGDISFLWQVAWRRVHFWYTLQDAKGIQFFRNPSSVLPKDDVCAWKLKKSLSSKLEK